MERVACFQPAFCDAEHQLTITMMPQIALDALTFAGNDEAFCIYTKVAYDLNAYEYSDEAGLEAIRNSAYSTGGGPADYQNRGQDAG